MINAQDLNFDLNDNGIFISGTHTPGEKLQYSVENGNNVSLKKEEIDIEVENIERSSDGTYKGVIRNVEPFSGRRGC